MEEEMDTVTSVQILYEAVIISYSAYTLEKGMNPTRESNDSSGLLWP